MTKTFWMTVPKGFDGNWKETDHEFTLDDGIMRWHPSGNIPPKNYVEEAHRQGFAVDIVSTNEERNQKMNEFLTKYREAHKDGPTDEERFEARAAHGPGVVITNIFTGRSFTT